MIVDEVYNDTYLRLIHFPQKVVSQVKNELKIELQDGLCLS